LFWGRQKANGSGSHRGDGRKKKNTPKPFGIPNSCTLGKRGDQGPNSKKGGKQKTATFSQAGGQ